MQISIIHKVKGAESDTIVFFVPKTAKNKCPSIQWWPDDDRTTTGNGQSDRTIGKQPEQITPRPVIANHGHWNLAVAHDHGVFNHVRFALFQDKIKQHSTSKRIAGYFATNSDC